MNYFNPDEWSSLAKAAVALDLVSWAFVIFAVTLDYLAALPNEKRTTARQFWCSVLLGWLVAPAVVFGVIVGVPVFILIYLGKFAKNVTIDAIKAPDITAGHSSVAKSSEKEGRVSVID